MKKLLHFFSGNRTAKNPYKKNFSAMLDFVENLGGIMKISITALILLLFAADYYTIYDLFREPQFNFNPLIQKILAVVVAAVLEGLPCLFSTALCKLMDTNITDQIERRKQKIILVISSVSIVFMFALVISLRVNVLIGNLGPEMQSELFNIIESISNKDGFALTQLIDILSSEKVSTHIFLIFSPIITSVFALLLSLGYTSSDYLDSLRRKYEAKHRKSQKANFNKFVAQGKVRTMKQELWNELGLFGTPPDDSDAFHKSIATAIGQRIEKDGVEAFNVQIRKFNTEIESVLQEYLFRISEFSSVPLEITGLCVRDIIAEYDNSVAEDFSAGNKTDEKATELSKMWAYHKCISPLTNELRSMITNASDEKGSTKRGPDDGPDGPDDAPDKDDVFDEVINDNPVNAGEGFGFNSPPAKQAKPFDSNNSDSAEQPIPSEKAIQKEFDSDKTDK